MITADQLQERLDRLASEHHVTGAAVALAHGDTVVTAHRGWANTATALPVRRDTLFAAGSVTKVFTTALVMSLVDDGLVDLDAPVPHYLPEFRVADPDAAGQITVRMLLNHTAGLPGHAMFDLPRSPEMLAQQVALLGGYRLNSPPGRHWSYSNGGMAVAGRITEVVTGRMWDDALADRILRPLGLHATTRPEEMVLDSTAVGHLVDAASGQVSRVPRLMVDSSNGPAGATLWCDIDAMIGFGRMHLRDGRASDGTRVLHAGSVRLMRTPSLDPGWELGFDDWGLGWYIRGAGADQTLGHTGGNAGSHSILTIAPEHDLAIAVLTNATTGMHVTGGLTRELLHDLCGIPSSATPTPSDAPVEVDLARYVGRYEADEATVTVTERDGRLRVVQETGPALVENVSMIIPGSLPLPPLTLTPFADDGRFLSDAGVPVSFVDDGAYAYVGRIFRRVPTA